MRNYQNKRGNQYYMPHNLYMQVQYKIRDYDRLKKERLDILYASPPLPDGQPRGSEPGNPTERKALKMVYIENELKAIDQAAVEVRGIYSAKVDDEFNPIKAYWCYDYFNYMHIRKTKDDEGPGVRTWNNFKTLFSGIIAKNLNLF